MNGIRKNYIIAKAAWLSAEEIQKVKYDEFLALKGISDEAMDDDFDALCAEYEIFAKDEIENSGIAWDNLKLAETAVMELAVSLYPERLQNQIRNGYKDYKYMEEAIDLIGRAPILKQSLRENSH